MNPRLRNILALVVGFVIGSVVNMCIIQVSGSIIPPPNGADMTTMEGLKAAMHLFEPKHFLMPFLAHAIGTLAGAMCTAWIAVSNKMRYTMSIGLIFLAGGIASVIMLPSPLWFTLLDLIVAYIPMAYLGARLMMPKV